MSLTSDLDTFFIKDKFENQTNAEKSFKALKLYMGSLDKNPTQSALSIYQEWKKWFNFGLDINGRDLQYVGRGFMVTKDGFKNAVISKYPKAKMDIQIVYKDDTLTYERNDSGVTYKYSAANPFVKKEVVGAFGFINTNDENNIQIFETLNMDEIDAMKASAKTDFIWKKWFDEMVRKSMIKRVCKRLFNDEKIDDIIDDDNKNFGADFELDENTMDNLAKKIAKNYKEAQEESM